MASGNAGSFAIGRDFADFSLESFHAIHFLAVLLFFVCLYLKCLAMAVIAVLYPIGLLVGGLFSGSQLR